MPQSLVGCRIAPHLCLYRISTDYSGSKKKALALFCPL